jgi:hypothetical protein
VIQARQEDLPMSDQFWLTKARLKRLDPRRGEPADVHAIATEYADWLGTSNVPKLFLKADPGAILANDTLVNLVRGWPALTEKTVAGIHFVQEDSPDEIGRDSAGWMGDLQRSQQQHSVRRQARAR